MLKIFKKKNDLNRGLYDSKYILKHFKTEGKIRKLSKRQLEKIMHTLEIDLQNQNNYQNSFFVWLGLYFAIFALAVPEMIDTGSNQHFIIDGMVFQLESVEFKMMDEEYNISPEGTTGIYTYDDQFGGNNLGIVRFSILFMFCVSFYYFFSTRHLKKVNKYYHLIRYIHSLK